MGSSRRSKTWLLAAEKIRGLQLEVTVTTSLKRTFTSRLIATIALISCGACLDKVTSVKVNDVQCHWFGCFKLSDGLRGAAFLDGPINNSESINYFLFQLPVFRSIGYRVERGCLDAQRTIRLSFVLLLA